MRTRVGWIAYALLSACWFGISFLWNSVHPILLPLLLLGSAEATKNTRYGLITFAGLIVALVVQPISGALSDVTRHRLGRRRPWMLSGTALCALWLLLMVSVRHPALIALAYLLLQASSNLVHGAAQGLIPDLVPVWRHGVAAGAKNLLDMLGIVAAALVMGRVMGDVSPSPLFAGAAIVLVLWAAVGVTCAGIREVPSAAPADIGRVDWADRLREALRFNLRGHRDYRRLLLARFCILYASFVVQSFALYFFRDALSLPSPARSMGRVMAIVGVSVLVVAYPAGALSERWGRKGLSVAACAVCAVGLGLLAANHQEQWLGALAALIGLGIGAFNTVNWAWATDLVPAAEAGKFLGFSNLATAGSAAVARLMGPVVDVVNARWPNTGYNMLFVMATASAVVGLIVTLTMPATRVRPPAA